MRKLTFETFVEDGKQTCAVRCAEWRGVADPEPETIVGGLTPEQSVAIVTGLRRAFHSGKVVGAQETLAATKKVADSFYGEM